MVACIIFDCDGTLVDSEDLGHEVLADHFVQHGIDISAKHLSDEFKGGQFAQMIDVLERRFNVTLPEHFIPEYRLKAERVFEQQLQACAGVKDALEQLDLPLCVASNAPVKKTKKSLEITGLAAHFGERIYSAYDINAWKPKPDLFLHAAAQMGFLAQHCMVVEDSEPGVKAALSAKMHTVLVGAAGVLDGSEGAQRISSMLELPQLLKQY